MLEGKSILLAASAIWWVLRLTWRADLLLALAFAVGGVHVCSFLARYFRTFAGTGRIVEPSLQLWRAEGSSQALALACFMIVIAACWILAANEASWLFLSHWKCNSRVIGATTACGASLGHSDLKRVHPAE